MIKRILLIIVLLAPVLSFSQKTYVPDDNFEQHLINLGYDNVLDDSVLTSNINTVSYLVLYSTLIIDLTGLEDFANLTELEH
jgi:hypothetical protein